MKFPTKWIDVDAANKHSKSKPNMLRMKQITGKKETDNDNTNVNLNRGIDEENGFLLESNQNIKYYLYSEELRA